MRPSRSPTRSGIGRRSPRRSNNVGHQAVAGAGQPGRRLPRVPPEDRPEARRRRGRPPPDDRHRGRRPRRRLRHLATPPLRGPRPPPPPPERRYTLPATTPTNCRRQVLASTAYSSRAVASGDDARPRSDEGRRTRPAARTRPRRDGGLARRPGHRLDRLLGHRGPPPTQTLGGPGRRRPRVRSPGETPNLRGELLRQGGARPRPRPAASRHRPPLARPPHRRRLAEPRRRPDDGRSLRHRRRPELRQRRDLGPRSPPRGGGDRLRRFAGGASSTAASRARVGPIPAPDVRPGDLVSLTSSAPETATTDAT